MKNRQDLPLKSDIAARFLPMIVGLMVYLGTLCLVFTLFIIHITQSWEMQFTTHLTVEIPSQPKVASGPLQAQVLSLLKRTPGVRQAAAVPPKDMEKLLASLLETKTMIDLPILIDISLEKNKKFDANTLTKQLQNISPHIQLIDDREWQHQIGTLINTIVTLASLLTLLILCATLITTTFATRTSLLIHRQVIEVLHLIGATNTYIGQQFQRHALRQGLIASTVGATMACLTFGGVILLLEKIGFSAAFNTSFFSEALCVFVLAPFITSFCMMLAARLTVIRDLYT